MNNALTTIAASLTVALASSAFAAPAATIYAQINPLLERAITLDTTQKSNALAALTKAQTLIAEQGQDVAAVLRDGINQSLSDAKVAVGRKSHVDVVTRVGLIRAILSKALYDDYFAALTKGDSKQASKLLPLVFKSSGLPASLAAQATPLSQKALEQPSDANRAAPVRSFFEKAYAKAILDQANAAVAGKSKNAFLDLTKSYQSYIVVQDSPRANTLSAKAFVSALGKLSSNNNTAFKAEAAAIVVAAKSFHANATALDPSQAKQLAISNPPTIGKRIVASNKALQATTQPSSSFLAVADRGLEDPTVRLKSDFATFIKSKDQLEVITNDLAAAKIFSLDQWLLRLQAISAAVLEANGLVQQNQLETASKAFGIAQNHYRKFIRPVASRLQPDLNQLIESDLSALVQEPNNTQVFNRLSQALSSIKKMPLGGVPKLQAPVTTGKFPGTAWLFLVLAMASLLPLKLQRVIFGGRNQYWRNISFAFIALMAPLYLQALGKLPEVVSFLPAQMKSLQVSEPLGSALWVLSAIVALGLSVSGLRGIASQFGLGPSGQHSVIKLSGTTTGETRATNPTQPQQPKTGEKEGTAESVVEWDEVF